MRAILIAALAGALLVAGCGSKADQAAAPATDGAWTIDKESSRLGFVGAQTGKEFTGEFAGYEATIVFDPDDLPSARIEAVVDVGSARTGERQRDAALPTADWFSAKAFPNATFSSSEIVRTGEGAYEARGKLTIRDTTRDLVLPFTLAIEGDRATADGALSLARTDFGVGQGEFSTGQWVGIEVKVSIHLEATR